MDIELAFLKLLDSFHLTKHNLGSKEWWKSIKLVGSPFFKVESDDSCKVLFLWQDPDGDENKSDIKNVLLNINSITDHYSLKPTCLIRLVNSDIWFTAISINSKWRSSYSFIPIKSNYLAPKLSNDSKRIREQQRDWWLSVVVNQVHDQLNHLPLISGDLGNSSALHLPQAGIELGWYKWERGMLKEISSNKIEEFEWSSDLLGNQRTCSFFSTTDGKAPLVLFLDGQKWGQQSGTLDVLQYLTDKKMIKPANYLLIPSINNQTRWKELSCYQPFWLAIIKELIPMLQKNYSLKENDISEYVIAGQSLGGLSCLYAGLNFSDYFTKIITSSGSFWWPSIDSMLDPKTYKKEHSDWNLVASENSLANLIQQNKLDPSHLTIYQSVGLSEKDLCVYNDIHYQALKQQGAKILYQKEYGGHDWLSWRSSLMNGLLNLIPF